MMAPETLREWARACALDEEYRGLMTYAEMLAEMQSGRFGIYLARELLNVGRVKDAAEALDAAIAALEAVRAS